MLHALGINYICSTVALLWSLHLYTYLVRRLTRYDTTDAKVANQANKIQVFTVLSLASVLMVFNLLVVPLPVPEGVVPGYGWWRYWVYLPGTSQFFFSMYPSLTWLGMTIYGCGLGLIMIKWKRSSSGYAKCNMVSWCLARNAIEPVNVRERITMTKRYLPWLFHCHKGAFRRLDRVVFVDSHYRRVWKHQSVAC